MSDGFDIFQQVFCLSMKICSAYSSTGDAESIAQVLQENLTQLYSNDSFASGDTWSTCWGPVVWKTAFSQFADQAIAVCLNETQNTYVVAIAATNPNSSFDVFYEDLAVPPKYMREIGAVAGSTSAGNYFALQSIMNQMTAKGMSLGSFLGSVAKPDATVVFCGHSLGGGLAPLLAASLYPGGTLSGGWGSVYTYGSAGPTTADSKFAAAFTAAFPVTGTKNPNTYAVWNSNMYNSRDMVPNAWASGQQSAPGLNCITATAFPFLIDDPTKMFFTNGAMTAVVMSIRGMAQALATQKTSTGEVVNPYTAVSQTKLFTGSRKFGQIEDSGTLYDELMYQHVSAYIEAFGVTQVIPPPEMIKAIQPPLLPLVRALSDAHADTAEMAPPRTSPEEH